MGAGTTAAEDHRTFHGVGHTPVGVGAQHVPGGAILFPDGTDHGWVLTIGSAVAYLSEQDAAALARILQQTARPKPGPRG